MKLLVEVNGSAVIVAVLGVPEDRATVPLTIIGLGSTVFAQVVVVPQSSITARESVPLASANSCVGVSVAKLAGFKVTLPPPMLPKTAPAPSMTLISSTPSIETKECPPETGPTAMPLPELGPSARLGAS